MLGIVGSSVLSGAISTLIGIMWLFFAIVVIFFKFGSFIFFLIMVSVSFSLFGFTAAMTTFGPQGSSGNVMLCIRRCIKCCKKGKEDNNIETKQDKAVSHVEMRWCWQYKIFILCLCDLWSIFNNQSTILMLRWIP